MLTLMNRCDSVVMSSCHTLSLSNVALSHGKCLMSAQRNFFGNYLRLHSDGLLFHEDQEKGTLYLVLTEISQSSKLEKINKSVLSIARSSVSTYFTFQTEAFDK